MDRVQRDQLDYGFTLIEVILYIGIFSLIIGGIVSLAFLSTAARSQNQTRADLNYQGQAVMASITQSIKNATAVTAPTPGNSGSSLSLNIADPLVDPTLFTIHSYAGYDALQIHEGSPATTNDLTNSRVSISHLTFTNMSVGTTSGSILIKFDLTYNNPLNRREFDNTQSFNGGATVP
jgi:type II secretory pathway pseudopilin PulG